ncbi:MAG: LysR family transcriptional regulator [Hyphomonadaceae bacterium]|nr:LysR family transcriptional regulator [Hyphomonadaceae bacterium]
MAGMNWDDLRILLAVAERGSFLKAGHVLSMAPSTISRRIDQLEEDVGVMLIERSVSGARLTARGTALAELAGKLDKDLLREIGKTDQPGDLRGTISISIGDGFIPSVSRLASAFSTEHPGCTVEVFVEDRISDVARGEVDLAIRTIRLSEAALIYRPISQLDFGFFANPDCLQRNAERMKPHLVDYVTVLPPLDSVPHLQFARELGFQKVTVRASSFAAQIAAVKEGAGVAVLPRVSVGKLQEVFKQYSLPPQTVYLVTRPSALKQPHIRRFVDQIYAFFDELNRRTQSRPT